MCNHENNVPSRLSPQWLCGNSCTWERNGRLHIAGTNSVCRESLMTTYIYINLHDICHMSYVICFEYIFCRDNMDTTLVSMFDEIFKVF